MASSKLRRSFALSDKASGATNPEQNHQEDVVSDSNERLPAAPLLLI